MSERTYIRKGDYYGGDVFLDDQPYDCYANIHWIAYTGGSVSISLDEDEAGHLGLLLLRFADTKDPDWREELECMKPGEIARLTGADR